MKLDQHFLKDRQTAGRIIRESGLDSKDVVFEIGPGKGILTKELARKAKKVIAVEIDKSLKKYLSGLPSNVAVLYGNALEKIEMVTFTKIVASIPFSISEPLFRKMLRLDFEKAVLLVGKSFYEAVSGSESKLAVLARVFFEIKKAADVPRAVFEPKPRTDSVILVFTKRKSPLAENEKVIREFALQADKKVKNALVNAFMRAKGIPKKHAKELVLGMNLPSAVLENNSDRISNEQFNDIAGRI